MTHEPNGRRATDTCHFMGISCGNGIFHLYFPVQISLLSNHELSFLFQCSNLESTLVVVRLTLIACTFTSTRSLLHVHVCGLRGNFDVHVHACRARFRTASHAVALCIHGHSRVPLGTCVTIIGSDTRKFRRRGSKYTRVVPTDLHPPRVLIRPRSISQPD